MRTKGRLMNYAHKKDQRCNVAIHHYVFPCFNKRGVCFYARRDIKAGEELRWDYGDIDSRILFTEPALEGNEADCNYEDDSSEDDEENEEHETFRLANNDNTQPTTVEPVCDTSS